MPTLQTRYLVLTGRWDVVYILKVRKTLKYIEACEFPNLHCICNNLKAAKAQAVGILHEKIHRAVRNQKDIRALKEKDL